MSSDKPGDHDNPESSDGGGPEPLKPDPLNAEGNQQGDASREDDSVDSAGSTTMEEEGGVVEATASLIGNLPSLARITSVIMLIVGILIVGLLFYKVMVGFFIPLFMAAAMVVIFHPVHAWFLDKLAGRRRVAAVATTSLILSIVLVPIILLISIAVGQLTGLVSRTDLDDVKAAMERGRTQFGFQLEHADLFRRLDDLSGLLDQVDEPELVRAQLIEAKGLIKFLDSEVESRFTAETAREYATERLTKLATVVDELETINRNDETGRRIAVEERFHRESVIASAAVHEWMNAKLGGSFRTQAKLLTNPSEKDIAEAIRSARVYLQPRFVKFSGVTGKAFLQTMIGLLIMVISIYFFLVDGPAMIRTLMRLSPLDDAYELRLLGEFEKTSRAVVLASVLSALVQGLLATIAYFFCGFESYILLFMVTTVMALIPFLGAASVWVPCAIYLAAVDQSYGLAIFMAIYGAAVVSSIDNVIKAYVLHGHSELHPLIALLSVLGGVPVFGPIGILIGPMVVVFLQTLLEILNHELQQRDAVESSVASEGDSV